MIPTRRTLLFLLVPTTLSVVAVFFPLALMSVVAADALILLMLLADAATLPSRRQLRLERHGDRNLSVGVRNRFRLGVSNRTARRIRVSLTESFPTTVAVEGLPATGFVPAHGRQQFEYAVLPQRRGGFEVGPTYLRVGSLLGLWQRQTRVQLAADLRVFPDIKLLNTYALLARRNRIDLMGFRLTKGRASDVEFDRLRDYQSDDDYRRIDPFASARYQKLITREYQVSRNQNVFFMIDCGRAMAAESTGLSNLDYALNAVLMLSFLALNSGDHVGLLAFDQTVHTYVPVGSGPGRKAALMHALYDLRVSDDEADYEVAFATLNRRLRKRSLVVLLTNVMDGASFSLLRPQLRVLTRRHLPLVLLLRDQDLFNLADQQPSRVAHFFEVGAAAELCTWREQLAARLTRHGALVLDLTPAQTTPRLINSYLRIKAEHLL